MRAHLRRGDAGYWTFGVGEYLDTLGARFQETCPHEVGLFLGIPYEDVIGFIKNGGKNSLFDGYRKVYARPDRARATFKAYDMAKGRMLRKLAVCCVNGRRIREPSFHARRLPETDGITSS